MRLVRAERTRVSAQMFGSLDALFIGNVLIYATLCLRFLSFALKDVRMSNQHNQQKQTPIICTLTKLTMEYAVAHIPVTNKTP